MLTTFSRLKHWRVLKHFLRLLLYGIALFLLFALEHPTEVIETLTGWDLTHSRILQPGLIYQTILWSDHREPRARFVRIVKFDPSKEPPKTEGCLGRYLEAKTLEAVAAAHPGLVVLDEFFDPNLCPDDDSSTAQLEVAIASITKAGIPIVIGRDTLDSPGGRVTVVQGVPFEGHGGNDKFLYYGHLWRGSDSRRIPLSYEGLQSSASAKEGLVPIELPSLPYQAASVYDGSATFLAKLKRLDARGTEPYTSFLKEEEFVEFEALNLICGQHATPQSVMWQSCNPSGYGSESLRGHIVLFGDRSDEDLHDSVLGEVPGYLLMANYIEGLLDDRVFLDVPWLIEFVFAIVLFAGTYFLFHLRRGRAALVIVIVVLAQFLAVFVMTVYLGYYLNIWFPSALVICAEFVNALALENDTTPH